MVKIVISIALGISCAKVFFFFLPFAVNKKNILVMVGWIKFNDENIHNNEYY